MIGDLEDVHRSTLRVDDEEHVELGEVHGVDGEQVRGEDALGLRGEKTAARTATAGSRTETVSVKDAPDQARRDANAKARSSPWMRTQPQRRFSRAVRTMSSTSSSSWAVDQGHAWIASAAIAPRELSVPTKERLWRDEEGAPAPSRQQPGEGGEDRPIHRAIGDAAH